MTMMRRLEIRPVVSRRLRAALLLVLSLSGISLSQSSLVDWPLLVVVLVLLLVFAQAWHSATRLPPLLVLSFRPLAAAMIDAVGNELPIRCLRLSVYPWLMVLHAEDVQHQRHVVVLLPDSLPDASADQWRQLLIWCKRMRRQIATH